jgi:hypothetical protein
VVLVQEKVAAGQEDILVMEVGEVICVLDVMLELVEQAVVEAVVVLAVLLMQKAQEVVV